MEHKPTLELKDSAGSAQETTFDCGYCGKGIVNHRASAWTANGSDLERFERWHGRKK